MAIKRAEFEITTKFNADSPGAETIKRDIESVTAATEKSTEGFHVHGEEARHMREALHLLGPEYKAIGEATHFLTNPLIAGIGLALVAFAKLRESLDETEKKLDELGSDAAKPIGDMLEAQAAAATDAAAAFDKYSIALQGASKSETEIDKQLRNSIALYNEELGLIEKVIKAREKAAGIEGGDHTEQFERAKTVNEITQTQAALDAAQKERAGISIDDLVAQRQAAEANEKNKDSSKSGLADDTKTRQTALDEAIKKFEKAQERYAGYMMKPSDPGYDPNNPAPSAMGQGALKNLQQAQREMDEATQARDQARQAEKSNQEAEARLKAQTEALTKEIEARTAHEQELSKLIQSYKDELEKARASLALHDRYAPLIANPTNKPAPSGPAPDRGIYDTRDIFSQQIAASIDEANAAIEHAEGAHGGHGTVPVLVDKLSHITQLLRRALDAHGDHSEQIAQLSYEIDSLEQALEKLQRQQSSLISRMNNGRGSAYN